MSRVRAGLWLLAGLTGVAVLFASQQYAIYRAESMPTPFAATVVMQMALWCPWAILGPLAWLQAARWPVREGDKFHNLVRHTALALAFAATLVAIYVAVYELLLHLPATVTWFTAVDRARPVRANAMFLFSAYFHIELLVYAAVVSVATAVRSNQELRTREREALQLSSQLATARLQVLTAQLQPHFLFNTLHTIGSLILQRNTEHAMQILAELGELLRLTLDRQSAELIPLHEELEHLRRYLRIEETRFGDRLTVTWRIDPAALSVLVPPLILQPIVENALKHGVSRRVEPAVVDLHAALVDGRLRVSVYNDGPLLDEAWSPDAFGFGLRNVHERLVTQGAGSALTLRNLEQRGVLAMLDLPVRIGAETSQGVLSG
jgi:two-component system, LytTR family, sensor kinase